MYISLTRLSYNSDEVVEFSIANKAGQKIVAITVGYVIDISGASIYESTQFENDCISRGRAINNFIESVNPFISLIGDFMNASNTNTRDDN